MAADKGTIVKQAQLYASRGQYDKAVAEWQKLLVGTHGDAVVHNTIGDLHVKRHAPMEAADAYLKAAEGFKGGGDPLKAIAVYRKVLKLDPNRLVVYQCLGDLNAERGLSSSAITEYTTLAKLLLKQGRPRDVVPVYRKMIGVEPSNLEFRRQLAELCHRENLRADAIEAYIDLGMEYHAQDRRGDARGAYETALKLDPDNARIKKLLEAVDGPQAAKPLKPATPAGKAAPGKAGAGGARQASLQAADRRIQAGDYGEAESALMEMLTREPGDPEVCRLLARLHLKRGELAVAKGEFQFLAGAAMRAEDHALAESMLTEYLAVDPDCPLVLETLGQVLEHKGDRAAAVERYAQALSLLLERPDPEQPTLPQDLLDKIKELAPDSELLPRLTAALRGEPGQPAADQDLEGVDRLEPAEAEAEAVAPDLDPSPAPPSVTTETVEEIAPVVAGPDTPAPSSTPAFRFVVSEPSQPEPTETEPVPRETAEAEADHVAATPAPLPADEPFPVLEAAGAEATAEPGGGGADVPDDEPLPEAIPAGLEGPEPPTASGEPAAPADEDSGPGAAPRPAVLLDEEEARARFELGVAYKHMGLFSEALEEFRLTIELKPLFLETCCMMAEVARDQGQVQEAVSYYEQALTAARDDEERAAEIRYELAALAQAEGWTEKAIALLSTIPNYRDAALRLEQLGAGAAESGLHEGSSETVMSGPNGREVEGAGKKRRVSYL